MSGQGFQQMGQPYGGPMGQPMRGPLGGSQGGPLGFQPQGMAQGSPLQNALTQRLAQSQQMQPPTPMQAPQGLQSTQPQPLMPQTATFNQHPMMMPVSPAMQPQQQQPQQGNEIGMGGRGISQGAFNPMNRPMVR